MSHLQCSEPICSTQQGLGTAGPTVPGVTAGLRGQPAPERHPRGTQELGRAAADSHPRAQLPCSSQPPMAACRAQMEARASSSLLEFQCWVAVILACRDEASLSDFIQFDMFKFAEDLSLLEALEGPNNMEPITLGIHEMYNVALEVFFISCPKQLHQHIK